MNGEPRRPLTMPCDIETRRKTTTRKKAWHADCPFPESCGCPEHENDKLQPQLTY